MAASVVTSATNNSATGTADVGSPSEGDALILLTAWDNAPSTTISTPPSGWTELWEETEAARVGYCGFKKIAGASEADPDIVLGSAQHQAHAVIIVPAAEWSGDLDDIEATFQTSTTDTGSPDPPDHTPAGGSAERLWGVAVAFDSGTAITITSYPSGYDDTQAHATQASGSAGVGIAVATKVATASSDDPGTLSVTSGHNMCATFSVLAASSGEAAAVTDGVKLGDSVSATLGEAASVTDGVKLGDSVAAVPGYSVSVSSGFLLGEDIDTTWRVDSGPDGFLLGDSAVATPHRPASAEDGFKLGDFASAIVASVAVAEDGFKLGDAVSVIPSFQTVVSSGLKLGDGVFGSGGFSAALTDGIKLGDSAQTRFDSCVAISGRVIDGHQAGNTSSDNSIELGNGTTDGISHAFQVPSDVTGEFVGECFRMSKNGTPTGNLTVAIYAATGTYGDGDVVPTGSALVTAATLDVSTLPDSGEPWSWIGFPLTGYEPDPSTVYTAVLSYNGGDGSNNLRIATRAGPAPFHDGNYALLQNGVWVPSSDDLQFSIKATDGYGLYDGFLLGDSVSAVVASQSAVTDGFLLGDSVVALPAGAKAVTDGFLLGDSVDVQPAYVTAVTDGFRLGDAAAGVPTYVTAVTDGFILGDSVSVVPAHLAAVVDGFKLGDSALGTVGGSLDLQIPFTATWDDPGRTATWS